MKTVEAQVLGDPMDEKTTMGPMNNDPVIRKVEAHIAEGVSEGR